MQYNQPMNRLSTEKRAAILGMLVEGNSLRATTRMASISINTVSKLLLDIGEPHFGDLVEQVGGVPGYQRLATAGYPGAADQR